MVLIESFPKRALADYGDFFSLQAMYGQLVFPWWFSVTICICYFFNAADRSKVNFEYAIVIFCLCIRDVLLLFLLLSIYLFNREINHGKPNHIRFR